MSSKGDSWDMLEFSSLGFIGKLFRSEDLSRVVNFLLMFYKDKPVDLIFLNENSMYHVGSNFPG